MPAPGFLEGEKGPFWLPSRGICEELVSSVFPSTSHRLKSRREREREKNEQEGNASNEMS